MLNVRATLTRLLTFRTIPVLNENDVVASSAASFGDNDRLAARVARLTESDTLVLLSNVAGLYSGDPSESPSVTLIREVHEVTPEIERMAGGAGSSYSSGGMAAKLAAARIVLASGISMAIADGRNAHPLTALDGSAPCTWFFPSNSRRIARKRRIARVLKPAGIIVASNAGASELRAGESLWAAGMVSFSGNFDRGDAVVIQDALGNEFARGLSIHSSAELRIARQGEKNSESPLCGSGSTCIVHRDDFALVE